MEYGGFMKNFLLITILLSSFNLMAQVNCSTIQSQDLRIICHQNNQILSHLKGGNVGGMGIEQAGWTCKVNIYNSVGGVARTAESFGNSVQQANQNGVKICRENSTGFSKDKCSGAVFDCYQI